MKSTLKECKECKKLYDIKNINFCLNLAISEKLNQNISKEEKEYLLEMNNLMTDSTGIKWCTCFTEDKQNYLEEAEEYLSNIDDFKSIEEEELGFDFKLNEDILYIANEHNFDSFLFLKFIKTLKSKLQDIELLNFDFINFDKMTSRDFKPKKYYSSPNYLLIYDFENLQEENIDLIIKLNNIIKQRKSIDKKTFILSNIKLEKLEKFLITRFYTKDEHIVLEFFNLLKNNFTPKIATTINQNGNVKLNTSSIKQRKQRKTKKQKQEEEKELEIDNPMDI